MSLSETEETSTEEKTPNKPITFHKKFYLPDSASGLSVFKVDGIHYKVHRYLLERESPVFETMFSSPSPFEGQDGESNERPINIPDVTRSEFEALLDFLYNGAFSGCDYFLDPVPLSTEKQKTKLLTEKIADIRSKISDDNTLFDLLSISLRFEFERITKTVLSTIDFFLNLDEWNTPARDLQAAKRINMALSHDILRYWILPAFQSLVSRPAPLTADEGRCLGFHRMAIVAAERERNIRKGGTVAIPPEFFLQQ